MSQMGGWSILDYGLHFAKDPTDYLRLGYASSLSSWALVNSGTAESGYGYWFPGKANDGATGGGFMPEAMGRAWIGKEMRAAPGTTAPKRTSATPGALRSHATIVDARPGVRRVRLRRPADARRPQSSRSCRATACACDST